MTQIAIICTITPVGPRKQGIAEQPFALQLSTAFIGPPKGGVAPIEPDDQLLPWTNFWQWMNPKKLVVRVAKLALDGSLDSYQDVTGDEVVDNSNKVIYRTPQLNADADKQIKRWIKDIKTDQYWQPTAINLPTGRAREERLLVEDLAFLSTFPGATAQVLNLSCYFKISGLNLDENHKWMFTVAPIFQNATPEKKFEFLKDNAWTKGWLYHDPGDITILRDYVVYTKPVNITVQKNSNLIFDEINNTNTNINFNNFWITTTEVSANELILAGTRAQNNFNENLDKKTEPTPFGLAAKFGDSESPTDHSPQMDTDIWRSLSGIGLLFREKDKNWHLLNTADLYFDQHQGDPDNLIFNRPALVPLRMAYRQPTEDEKKLRHLTINYNQKSLSAPSPLAKIFGEHFSLTQQTALTNTDLTSNYCYGAVRDNNNLLRLQRIKFNKDYQLLPFVMDNAGGLPEELCDSNPWVFSEKFNDSILPGAVLNLERYFRKTPIGHIRVTTNIDSQTEIDQANWPAIPTNVFPLASEIEINNSSESINEKIPLLLLYGFNRKTNRFIFGIKPPSVDINVMEQWLEESTPDQKRHVKQLWIDYISRIIKRKPGSIADDNEDISLDDPAVIGYIFRLEHWNWQTDRWDSIPLIKREITLSATLGIVRHQSDWLRIECQTGDNWELNNGAAITVKVKKEDENNGEVNIGRLSIYALTSKTEVRFKSDFLQSLDVLSEETDFPAAWQTDYNILKPYRVKFETPTKILPTSGELWESLKLTVLPDQRQVDIGLKIESDLLPKFRNIYRLELLKQQWRWQGRPINSPNKADWPTPGALDLSIDNPATTALLKWEVVAFAEMDDRLDTLIQSLTDPTRTSLINRLESQLYSDHLDDYFAHYLRYGLTAYSRYQGIFNDLLTQTSQQTKPFNITGVGWQRAFLAYNGPKPHKPVITAIIPLTQEYRCMPDVPNLSVPPLMVILNETAFSYCGVSEGIECQIDKVLNTDIYQYGEDPILSTRAFESTLENNSFKIVGPFGYTFDTDARQSLFSSSSYLIMPMDITQAWDFARVRFRRITGNKVLDDQALGDEEQWTKSSWIQFPASALFGINWEKNRFVLKEDRSWEWELTPFIQEEKAIQIKVHPLFTYVLLITKEIKDYRGLPGYEIYRGITAIKIVRDNILSFKLPELITEKDLMIRVLEIQLTPGVELENPSQSFEAENNFWESLFGRADVSVVDQQDAKARITRISPAVRLSNR